MDMHTQQEKASILLIYTGGTIGMIENPETGVLESFNFQHLKDNMPELKKLGYSVATIQFDPPMDSSEMGPDSWMKIVKIIADNYQKYDGFVVLHGTDTMSYTASALSFMLENLSKPVILTGSQLPIGMLRTDGKENLITAIETAAAKENGLPLVPEVCIFFENDLLRGNRTSKINADNFNAFRSYNYPALAHAGIYIKYDLPQVYHPVSRKPLKPQYRYTKTIPRNFSASSGKYPEYPGSERRGDGNIRKRKCSVRGMVLEYVEGGCRPWYRHRECYSV